MRETTRSALRTTATNFTERKQGQNLRAGGDVDPSHVPLIVEGAGIGEVEVDVHYRSACDHVECRTEVDRDCLVECGFQLNEAPRAGTGKGIVWLLASPSGLFEVKF